MKSPVIVLAVIATCQVFSSSHVRLSCVGKSVSISGCRWRMTAADHDVFKEFKTQAEALNLEGENRELFLMQMVSWHKQKEKEKELALERADFNFNNKLAATKERARRMGQRAVYEKFLSQCWGEVKQLDQKIITQIRTSVKEFPRKPQEKQRFAQYLDVHFLCVLTVGCTCAGASEDHCRQDHAVGHSRNSTNLFEGYG